MERKSKTYKGWTFKPFCGVQLDYRLPNSRSLAKQIGIGTHRKITGYELHTPDGEVIKIVDTLKQAREYVDNY